MLLISLWHVRKLSGLPVMTWNGVVTVTTVTRAPRAFAKATPSSSAIFDSSDPSVGMRMCLIHCSSSACDGNHTPSAQGKVLI